MDEKTRENNRLRQRKYLALHKDEVNAKRRERYHQRVSAGRCPRCACKTKKGQTICTKCCDYMRDLNRKYAKQKKAAAAKAKRTPATKTKTKAKSKAKK